MRGHQVKSAFWLDTSPQCLVLFSAYSVRQPSLPTGNFIISFGGTFAIIIGLAALPPSSQSHPCGYLANHSAKFGLLGRLVPCNVIRSQSCTAVAVTALMLAVSVTIGVQVIISSFRITVVLWLEQTLQGGIYLSAPGLSAMRPDTPLDPQAIALAQAYPQAEGSTVVRIVTVESDQGTVQLVAVNEKPEMNAAYSSPCKAVHKKHGDGAILLSEPLANRLGISSLL